MKNNKLIPTEDAEAMAFAEWLRLKRYRFSHIVNELKSRNWGAWKKSQALGLNPGVPDYIIFGKNKLLCVELKRSKGGRVSPEQQEWIKALNGCEGVYAQVCYGADEAIRFVQYCEGQLTA